MDAVEEIKSRLDIEDVISEYVQLKRSGRNFKGLSPFNNEKTPSFMVSPEKQIWHDFSSGKGGNMFSFVMEMVGLDFKGALELLARKAGVDLSQYRQGGSAESSRLKERLYAANELAAKFYQTQFKQHKTALDYIFTKRKFNKDVVLTFRIGYSPNNGTALLDFLKKKGFTENEMTKAGLISKRYRGASDMFRGRIQVPLMDAQGRVIGFTARLLEDNPDAPKYLNTPQTMLYDKGRHVFGLHLAKEAIRSSGYVVVVEGNLDVIASHQAGIKHVVATAGTAMTESHMKTLGRFTPDIRLAFDQDKAGQAAAERSIPLASKADVSLSIVTIPEGKDPDELIRKDPAKWEAILSENQYALDWLIDRYSIALDLANAEDKRKFSDVLIDVVRRLNDPVEQDHYVRRLADIIGVSKDAMERKLSNKEQKQPPRRKSRMTVPVRSPSEEVEQAKTQDHLLSLALHRQDLRIRLERLTEDMFRGEHPQKLFRFLSEHPDYDGKGRFATLQQISEYIKIIRLQYETLYQGLDELELGYEADRLSIRLIEMYVKSKKAHITHELQEADETRTKQLLEDARALDMLRKKL